MDLTGTNLTAMTGIFANRLEGTIPLTTNNYCSPACMRSADPIRLRLPSVRMMEIAKFYKLSSTWARILNKRPMVGCCSIKNYDSV